METHQRPSRDELHLGICSLISQRSTCQRGQVGCVIVKYGRIITSGYNGALKGMEHCDVCDITQGCQHAVHAEANAIGFAAREGIPLIGTTLYCTHHPCRNCSFLIAQAGIIRVVYINEYRDTSASLYLKSQGIQLVKHEQI